MQGYEDDRTVSVSAYNTYEHEESWEQAGEGTVAFSLGLLFQWGVLKEFTQGNVPNQANLARIKTDGVRKETTVNKNKNGAVTSSTATQYAYVGSSQPIGLYMAPVKTNLFTSFVSNHVAGTIIKTNYAHEGKRGVTVTWNIDLQRRPK